jgi:carbonic anhydrase
MTINEVLNRLKEGNQRFCQDQIIGDKQDSKRRREIVDGQNPFAIILSCADSRVVPELIFDTGLGELFVVRVAGNIANTSTVASIEYAVAFLNIQVIVVLGHENCGAVTLAVSGSVEDGNAQHILEHIHHAIDECPDGEVNEVAKKNAELTVKELIKRSSILQQALENKQLKIIPAFYLLESGKVLYL